MIESHEINPLLEQAKARINYLEANRSADIAIIGMACQLPDCSDPDSFWDILSSGQCAIKSVPPGRLHLDPAYANKAGFMDEIAYFDPGFFNMSKREADAMDPQHRLLLETSWHALEDALIPLGKLRGSDTGIFIGLSWHDYEKIAYGVDPRGVNAYTGLGNMQSLAPGRIAYFLGTQGPAILLDTACSSSLVAVHEAVKSLRTRETSLALAGGISLILSKLSTLLCRELNALSPTNDSKIFDNNANGYVRGEGVGMVVLKRLDDAITDRDRILGVIKGSAVNHNGKSGGLTVPNRQAQKRLIESALLDACLSIADIDYMEAHGTGTVLGDPIEVGAISDIKEQCEKEMYIGSVKANIGHLEAAAGVASLIKSVLMLQKRSIPPQINIDQLNQHIDWGISNIRITQTLKVIDNPNCTIGINSFGIGGTNAHLIVTAYQSPEPVITEHSPCIFVLSAKSQSALRKLAKTYAEWILTDGDVSLADLCFSLQTGRTHFRHRLAFVVCHVEDIVRNLERYLADQPIIDDLPDFLSLQTLCTDYLGGSIPNWLDLYRDKQLPSKISLKNYIFDHEYCWVKHDYSNLEDINASQAMDYLQDHKLNGQVIYPGTGYIHAICEKLIKLESSFVSLENLEYRKPLYITDDRIPDFSVELTSNHHINVNYHGTTYCQCQLSQVSTFSDVKDASQLLTMPAKYIDVQDFYDEIYKKGYELTGLFQSIYEIRQLDQLRFLVCIKNSQTRHGLLHPAILDACFHLSFLLLDKNASYIPAGIQTLKMKPVSSGILWSYIFMENDVVNCSIYTQSLSCFAQITGLSFKKIASTNSANDIKKWITLEVAKLTGFKIDHIHTDTSFWDLGFDSLMWIELKDTIDQKFQQFLDDTVIFNYPTIDQLSNYIYNEFFSEAKVLASEAAIQLKKELLNEPS